MSSAELLTSSRCRKDQLPLITCARSSSAIIAPCSRPLALTLSPPDYWQDLSQRATIERIIANLVRYHGARHARRRDRSWCDYQVKMNATAFNIRQWLRRRQCLTPTPAQTPCP